MFHTFSASKGSSASSTNNAFKRQKVSHACDNCRLHRIRCDDNSPCSQCKETKILCCRSQPASTNNLSQAKRRIEDLKEKLRRYETASLPYIQDDEDFSPSRSINNDRVEVGVDVTGSTQHTYDEPTYAILTPVSRIDQTSSTADTPISFAHKINSFFDSASKAVHQYPIDRPIPKYTTPNSVYVTSSLESAVPPVTRLSKDSTSYFLNLYWTTYHVHIPILDEVSFQETFENLWKENGDQLTNSPLVDALIALCQQYAHGSDMVSRVIALRQFACTFEGDVALAGFCYLRRCRKAIDASATSADPSLSTVQAYIFMIVYLLNAGQYQTAYAMLGLAVRIAHLLDLHQEPSHGLSLIEAERQKRTWWVLVQLDTRCSNELGKPKAIHLHDISCTFPKYCIVDGSVDPSMLKYHVLSVKLTAASLRVDEILSQFKRRSGGDNPTESIEIRADWLVEALGSIRDWQAEASAVLPEVCLRTIPSASLPFASSSTSWMIRERVSLELQYHNILLMLHRPFITFPPPDAPLAPRHTAKADEHAMTCIRHAIAITDKISITMSRSDVLYGWYEVFQLQWNAVLAIVGFLLAYPLCPNVPAARAKLNQALQLFDAFKDKHAVASRAAELTGVLCTRVDGLIEKVKAGAGGGDERVQIPPSSDDDTHHQADTQMQEEQLQEDNFEDLWSWMQDLDPQTWAGYHTDLEELLNSANDM